MSIETTDPAEAESRTLMGAAVQRREDPALLSGDAEYTDDIQYPRMAHLAIVRSQYGHARIEGVDTSAAEAIDGVLGVFTGRDVEASDSPGDIDLRAAPSYADIPDRPMIATDRVRYQGDAVAAVVAEDRYTAHEAADRIEVEYDRLDAVTDPREATREDAPAVHDDIDDNVCFEREVGDAEATDEAFAAADRTVEIDLENQRLVPNAMEPRAAVARYVASTGELTVDLTSQNPHHHQQLLAETLGVPETKIRVRAPDVGGGFGSKIHHYPGDAITAWCSIQLERPVKWQATRSEAYMGDAHGRGHRTRAELAFDDDGRIRGLRVETHADIGAYLSTVAVAPVNAYTKMLSGQYDIPALHGRAYGVFTNTAPVDAYRGAGRPEASYLIERVVERAARELGVDPVELRRRNFIRPEQFPHEVPTGHEYDSGDYEKALDKALDLVDYEEFRERQAEAREDGRYLGIGVSCYVEACGSAPGLFESGMVRVTPSGDVRVGVGTADQGQGHATTFAQIVADELGVDYDAVEVAEGDTGEVPQGSGTYGSRSVAVGGSAVAESARTVREKARRIAAHQLEAPEEDVEFEDGTFRIAGAPERSMTIREIADEAYAKDNLPEGMEPGLESTSYYDPENYTFPFGTHVAVVEVDPDTGEIEFERYVAVDDVGNQINPKLVEGQVHGGIAQGIGQALYEGAEYDENGTLVTGSMQDYAVPKAEHVPEMELDETVTESPHNPLGAKGVGEAGAIAAPGAVANAVMDALEPFGVEHVDMPLSPEAIWRAIRGAGGEIAQPGSRNR